MSRICPECRLPVNPREPHDCPADPEQPDDDPGDEAA